MHMHKDGCENGTVLVQDRNKVSRIVTVSCPLYKGTALRESASKELSLRAHFRRHSSRKCWQEFFWDKRWILLPLFSLWSLWS